MSSTPSGVLRPRERLLARWPDLLVVRIGGLPDDCGRPHQPAPAADPSTKPGLVSHGMRFSSDGDTMYVADMGTPSSNSVLDQPGLRIFDVSEVNDRVARTQDPRGRTAAVAGGVDPAGRRAVHPRRSRVPPRGRRVQRPVRRRVHLHHQRAGRRRPDHQRRRPGAAVRRLRSPARGPPAGEPHRRAVRRPRCGEPGRWLRRALLLGPDPRRPADRGVLDDRVRTADLRHQRPRAPTRGRLLQQARQERQHALSQPAWDVADGSVWYSDASSGMYVVRLRGAARDLLVP